MSHVNGFGLQNIVHASPDFSEFDSDYGSLSIESQQQLSDPASVGKLQRSPPISSTTFNPYPVNNMAIIQNEEYRLLMQLLAENAAYPCFGFILDKNGTIERAAGSVEHFLGLNASQLENQKLMRYISNRDKQKICGILPSASTNATRKQTEVEFLCEKTKHSFRMDVLSQTIYTNLQSSTNFGKRPCVVCVAKQSNGEQIVSRPQSPTFVLRIEPKNRQILNVEFNSENKFNLNATDFIGHPLETICHQNDRPLLDALLDSPSSCSAKLMFTIQNQQLSVLVSKSLNGDEILLECSYGQSSTQPTFQNQIASPIKTPLELSDKNFNYQPQLNMFNENQQHSKIYNFQETAESIQPFHYSNYSQETQQPQLQPTNIFSNEFEFNCEESLPAQPVKKQRKPRKPRNPSTQPPKNGRNRGKSKVDNQLDAWPQRNTIVAGNYDPIQANQIQITGQPYPAPQNDYTMNHYNSLLPNFPGQLQIENPEVDPKQPKKRQRKANPNKQPNNRGRNKQKDNEDQESLIGNMYKTGSSSQIASCGSNFGGFASGEVCIPQQQFSHQFPSTSSNSCGSSFANQSFEANSRTTAPTTMSSSQVANGYMNAGTIPQPQNMSSCMPGMPYNTGQMNPMSMNGMPYQMQQQIGVGQQQAWAQQQGMISQPGNDFHPLYHQQNQMQQMMYNQQVNLGPNTSSQTPPAKKAGAKRKNNQQVNTNSGPGRQAKQQSFLPNGMQQNGMNGMMAPQHYQQFPQSNQMYNPAMMAQPNIQHVAQMNQQQQLLAQQQMMANSPQFSSPTTPINHVSPYQNSQNSYEKQQAQWGQKSSEAVRMELRNTLQTRQNANSPQPHSTSGQPHSVPSSVMPMNNEMSNSRFPTSNEPIPNLLSPPRMVPNQQQQIGAYNGMQNQQINSQFQQQNGLRSNNLNGMPHDKAVELQRQFLLSDFDLDHKSAEIFQSTDDSLHIDTPFFDFGLFSGRFDMENEETRLMVEKLLG